MAASEADLIWERVLVRPSIWLALRLPTSRESNLAELATSSPEKVALPEESMLVTVFS